MIKVLVAEDELPLLRGISRLIEKINSDFTVVKMAKTGKEAMDYLEEYPVDVVFTDINMPVVDGLELLEYVSGKMPSAASVVISGYQDFTYAQKALRFGVKNYLVKPVDKKELEQLLEQLKDGFYARERERKGRMLGDMVHGKIVQGKKQGQGAAAFCRIYPVYLIAKAYCVYSMEEEELEPEIWKDWKVEEFPWLDQYGIERIYSYDGRNGNEMLLLLEAADEPDVEGLIGRMREWGGIGCPVAAAVGEPAADGTDMRKDIGKLQRKIYANWIYGRSGIVDGEGEELFHLSKTAEEALQYMIKNRQYKDFRKLMLDIKEQMRLEGITQRSLERCLDNIMMFLRAYGTAFQGKAEGDLRYEINGIVVRADNLDEIFEEFLLWCHELMFTESEEDTKALMGKLDVYIQTHYKEALSTKMLALEFGLVPSYLSKLFQDYKGLTPNHYIQEIRIEKAKELLADCPGMMTKDIALMIGYADPSYFSKVFKKSTGVYPSEYRIKDK